MNGTNLFDRAVINVPALFERKQTQTPKIRFNPFIKIYRAWWLPLPIRQILWKIFTQIHLDEMWFHEFKSYWSGVLGLRPLWGIEDFYFLRGQYRVAHQDAKIEDLSSTGHIQAWQHPKLTYFLFQQAYVESKYRPFEVLTLLNQHLRVNRPVILEYGAGIGSITQTIFDFNFSLARRSTFLLSDLRTLASHYSQWRFANQSNVHLSFLDEDNGFQLRDVGRTFDVIFCTAVFEHLNAPLKTIQRFHELLSPGGLLFFDYVLSDAEGLDTQAGLEQRQDVLTFLREHFELVSTNELQLNASIPLTLARKRSVS